MSSSGPQRRPCAPPDVARDAVNADDAHALEADGSMLEGVLDLAFEEDGGGTVMDFKTQAELAGPLARYRRQVGAYASVVARVTGRPATAVLMRL